MCRLSFHIYESGRGTIRKEERNQGKGVRKGKGERICSKDVICTQENFTMKPIVLYNEYVLIKMFLKMYH
jgi:hypothetical protein